MIKDNRSLDTNLADHLTYLQYQQFINEFTDSKIKFPKKFKGKIFEIEKFNKASKLIKLIYLLKLVSKNLRNYKSLKLITNSIYKKIFIENVITSFPDEISFDLKLFLFSHYLDHNIKKLQILKNQIKNDKFKNDKLKKIFDLLYKKKLINFNNYLKPHHHKKKLNTNFVIAIMTTVDSDIFKSSIISLIESDFSGQVIVIENNTTETCKSFIDKIKNIYSNITYICSGIYGGTSHAFNLATKSAINIDYEFITFCHNDILWPKKWYKDTYQTLNDNPELGLYNFSFIQLNKLDNVSKFYVMNNQYYELKWSLEKLIDTGLKRNIYQDCRLNNNSKIGLSRDPWNDELSDLRIQAGRFSVASCLSKKIITQIYPFDENLFFGPDNEIHHFCLKNKLWFAWIDNMPLIHIRSFDTRNMSEIRSQKFGNDIKLMEANFKKKYGYNIHCFHNTLFSKCLIKYRDEIEKNLNSKEYEKIEFFFKYFWDEMNNFDNDKCMSPDCRNCMNSI